MKKKSLWIYIFGITIIIIGLIKLDTLISMVSILWNACRVLVFGAMMAFVINLVMAKIEKRLGFMKKGKRATSLLLSLILIFLFVYFLITLVVPSLSEAIGVIVAVLPKYFENTQKFLVNLFENNPQLANSINNLDIDWKNLIQSGINVLSTGVTNVVGTTFNVVTVIVNSVFNFVLMFIFAIYVLLEKERFIQLYHRLTNLYLSETVKRRMDTIESFSTKWFANVFALKSFRRSFLTSLEVALLATCISLLVGIPAAYALARSGLKGKQLLKSIFLSPTIVPGIVIGFIMYQCLILTLRIPVFAGLLAGHFMVTLPYVIRVVGSSMEQFDFSIEEAAWSLGCPKGTAFFKVVLPNVTSGISSAFMLAFINSFNNIPVSMFLSGPGVSTFPSTLMNYIEYNYDPTVSAVSVLLMAATVIIMVIVDRTLGIAALAK